MKKNVNGVTCVDLPRVWQQLEGVSHAHKLNHFLTSVGCTFFDDECTVVNQPVVGLVGVGGLPLSFNTQGDLMVLGQPTTLETIVAHMETMRGLAGCMTNMNPGKKSLTAMATVLDEHGHTSAYRANTLDILFAGYPSAIEPNFQRLYKYAHHIAVLTLTRTGAQHHPVQVALSPEGYNRIQQQRAYWGTVRSIPKPTIEDRDARLDWVEEFNSETPKNTAMAMVVSMDLKNIKNTMNDLTDTGQELAWRRLWMLLNEQLHILWPSFFQSNASYGLEYPKHWSHS